MGRGREKRKRRWVGRRGGRENEGRERERKEKKKMGRRA